MRVAFDRKVSDISLFAHEKVESVTCANAKVPLKCRILADYIFCFNSKNIADIRHLDLLNKLGAQLFPNLGPQET